MERFVVRALQSTLAFLAACGPTSSGDVVIPADAADAFDIVSPMDGSGSDVTAESLDDGSDTIDAPPVDAGPCPPGLTNPVGVVSAMQFATPSGYPGNPWFAVTATIFDPGAPGMRRCRLTTEGNCTFADCRGCTDCCSTPNAGDVQFMWTGDAGNTLTALALPPDGHYASAVMQTEDWPPGTPMSMGPVGSGTAPIPAFHASLVFPPMITVTNPASGPSMITLARTADFTAMWTASSDEVAVIVLQNATLQFDALNAGVAIVCSFAGADGRGVLPASMLARLGPSAANPSGRTILSVMPRRSQTLTAGAWSIVASVVSPGVSVVANVP